ncbi:alkene reductase, partial [Klebsiella pneumoniae]|nr:alkene reductase [Klebsiella pneumoniae]
HEVKRITADFVHSARLAMEAGFDGVEIMAANGFIFDQFLSSELNTRTDEYGGSVENRQRFLLETIDAVAEAVGNSHVAVRLSPFGRIYDLAPYE